MGAKKRDFNFHFASGPIGEIDLALKKGKDIPLADVETPSGLLAYKGRQVLLYIRDHGWNVQKAAMDGESGKRFHVADCKTLQDMRNRNRYDRYVATNDLSGTFEITGIDPVTRTKVSKTAQLKVCINCLKKINYKGYNSIAGNPRELIWRHFSIDEFFKTYSSVFKYLPRSDPDDHGQYTDDWPMISATYKTEKGSRCESCGVDLSEHTRLLHTHHVNGVKSDNRKTNLKALCIDCHRKQAQHDHIFVDHATMQTITRLRRKQSIANRGEWDEVMELADPAVNGVLFKVQRAGMPVPVIGHELQLPSGEVTAQLELAWPDRNVGIAIDENDATAAIDQGWSVWGIEKALDDFDAFEEEVTGYASRLSW